MLRTRNRRAIVFDVLDDLQDISKEDSEWNSYEIENKSVYNQYITLVLINVDKQYFVNASFL